MTGPSPSPLFAALQRVVMGRYSIDRQVGAGGMGIVFLARDVRLDRAVAIKVIRSELASRPEARERFLVEARLAAGLAHPNIVPIHEVDSAGELTWYVMEFIHGQTLGEMLRRRGPLAAGEVARILREVAWALSYAHGRGIVHRDIKPDNIFVERGGRVLVLDFGIAQRTEESADAIGTLGFLPPEQRRPGPPDPRSDLYALAITAATGLRAQVPPDAPTAGAWIGTEAPWAAPLLTACLAADPTDRPASARIVAERLVPPVAQPIHPAVRRWMTEAGQVRTIAWGWTLFMALTAVFGAMRMGERALLVGLTWAFGIWPLAGGVRLWQTQRVLRQGLRLDSLREGLQRLAEERRRELRGRRGGHTRRMAAVVAQISLTLGGFVVFHAVLYHAPATFVAFFSMVAVGVLLLALLIGAVEGNRRQLRDPVIERRRVFWQGNGGALFARLAGLGLRSTGPRGVPQVAEHAEISLADEIRAGIDGLPPRLRPLFGDALTTADRLARAATRLADRHSRLAAVLTRTPERRATIEAAIEGVTRRQAEVLASLQAIRATVLAARGGTAAVGAITMAVEDAQAVAERVQHLAEARQELEEFL